MIVEIFNKLKLSDLAQATRVCQEWHRLVDEKMKKEKSIWLNQHAFGKEQWKRYFDVSIESAPPYQRGFMANCLSKIPGNPKKK
ncbi:MAG: F-box protein [Chlamydiales bacterium]|nr:F-box protein [Chlamydiia bacterium]MCP5508420.1 F-box protein [Chlamydiales bacterium]